VASKEKPGKQVEQSMEVTSCTEDEAFCVDR